MNRQQVLDELNGNAQIAGFLSELCKRAPAIQKRARVKTFNEFERSEAKDLFPHYRRANFEKMLAQVANEYGFQQTPVLNQARNSHHREIKIGSLLFIGHYVAGPHHLFRESNYRKTLAAEAQGFLPGFCEDQGIVDFGSGKHVLGFLLHGQIENLDEEEAVPFLRLAIPNRELSQYMMNFDLMDMFGKAEKSGIVNDIVTVQDDVKPIFRDLEKEGQS